MRRILLVSITILLLAASLSTASFADGGDPPPLCAPNHPNCDLVP